MSVKLTGHKHAKLTDSMKVWNVSGFLFVVRNHTNQYCVAK